MEFRVLRYFLAVAREQSISAAAQALHLTQPTLSRQLRELEEELGKQLMVRGSRRIELTEERNAAPEAGGRDNGARLPHAGGTLQPGRGRDGRRVHRHRRDGRGTPPGQGRAAARVKAAPASASTSLAGMLPTSASGWTRGCWTSAFCWATSTRRSITTYSCPCASVWGVLMPRSSPLAELESVRPRDLWDKPLILSRQVDNKSGLYRWLGREPDQLNTVATYNLIYNASLMVDEGHGLRLHPGQAGKHHGQPASASAPSNPG